MHSSADLRAGLTRAMTAAIVGKVIQFTMSRSAAIPTSWSAWLDDWKHTAPQPIAAASSNNNNNNNPFGPVGDTVKAFFSQPQTQQADTPQALENNDNKDNADDATSRKSPAMMVLEDEELA